MSRGRTSFTPQSAVLKKKNRCVLKPQHVLLIFNVVFPLELLVLTAGYIKIYGKHHLFEQKSEVWSIMELNYLLMGHGLVVELAVLVKGWTQ